MLRKFIWQPSTKPGRHIKTTRIEGESLPEKRSPTKLLGVLSKSSMKKSWKMDQQRKKRSNKMNKNILEGKWKQLRGEIRDRWGELTNDDLDQIAGKREKLSGLLQERYGYTQMEAERQIDEFLERWEVFD